MHAALAHAWSLHQSGEREAAERAYLELLGREPDHADALNCYGILLMQTARVEEAAALFERALAAAPAQHAFATNLARAALRQGRGDAALAASEQAIAHGAGAGAWLLRAVALRDLDRIDEARAVLRDALQRYPAEPAVSYNLAMIELAAGDAAAAAARLQDLLQRRPRDAHLWVALGNAQAARDDLDATEQAYVRALELDPDAAEAQRLLGITRLQRAQPAQALAPLRAALRRDPRDQAALAALGVAATLCEDPLARVLLDFDALIEAGVLAPDAAFDGAALAAEILAHPTLRADRAQKTTRDGAQSGNLADAQTPALQAFVAALRRELDARVARAARRYAGQAHPLAHTQPSRWQLNLWATVLRRQGRQEPHLHPAGWMSGVYYVALPDVAAESDAGWIEFGTPPAALAQDARLPQRRLQPLPGQLLTFPSYLYHRTLPHAGEAPRISLAFDLVPLDRA
jgi:uncharacterized protein (TIGR02466 family)